MSEPVSLIPPARTSRWVLLIALIFSACSTYESFRGEGFLEADACTHYVYARKVWNYHPLLADLWGRPLCTGMYAIPAHFGGRHGVHFLSLALALLTAGLAMDIARRQEYRWPILAFAFTLAQPMMFTHSFSELTELPFAALLAVAFWAYQRRWWGLMAIAVGCLPLGRPEGFGFIAMAAVALVMHRRFYWLPLLVIPLAAWSYVGWLWVPVSPPCPWWAWLQRQWPWDTKSVYEPGPLLHFLGLLPWVVSPLLVPAVGVGVWRSLLPREMDTAHRRRVQQLIAIIPLLIFIGHSVLYWRGKMASNGEPRYMLIVAPFWGLLAALGYQWLASLFALRRPMAWAAAIVTLPWIANIHYQALPLRSDKDWHAAQVFFDWYEHNPIRQKYPHLMTSHTSFFYLLNELPNERDVTVEWHQHMVHDAPPGTMLIWDAGYAMHNSAAERVIPLPMIEQAGWIEAPDLSKRLNDMDPKPQWHVFLSPHTITGGTTSPQE